MKKHYILTLEDLHYILQRKHYFTKERFYHYFSIIGCDNNEIKEYWNILEYFPHFNIESLEKVSFVLKNIINFPFPSEYYEKNGYYNPKENRKKIYYIHEEKTKFLEFNLNEKSEVILYADFLKKGYEIIVAVDLVESFYDKSKTWLMYDGDIFATKDNWNNKEDGEIIVCTKDGYRKLLYTKGRGYVRNGKPDYDERESSHYALTMKSNFHYIGNVYVDLSFLIDQEAKEEGDE